MDFADNKETIAVNDLKVLRLKRILKIKIIFKTKLIYLKL